MKQDFLIGHNMNEICINCEKTYGEHHSYPFSLFNISYCNKESLNTKKGLRFTKIQLNKQGGLKNGRS